MQAAAKWNDEIGELDSDDEGTRGNKDISQFRNVITDFLETAEKVRGVPIVPEKQEFIKKSIQLLELYESTEQEVEMVEEESSDSFDVESIVSTYTNTDNHPAVISEKKIKLSKKTGIPLNVLPNQPKPQEKPARENKGQARKSKESAEEKKERKKKIKDERKSKREEKKQLKLAYRGEERRQIGSAIVQASTGNAPNASVIKYN